MFQQEESYISISWCSIIEHQLKKHGSAYTTICLLSNVEGKRKTDSKDSGEKKINLMLNMMLLENDGWRDRITIVWSVWKNWMNNSPWKAYLKETGMVGHVIQGIAYPDSSYVWRKKS